MRRSTRSQKLRRLVDPDPRVAAADELLGRRALRAWLGREHHRLGLTPAGRGEQSILPGSESAGVHHRSHLGGLLGPLEELATAGP